MSGNPPRRSALTRTPEAHPAETAAAAAAAPRANPAPPTPAISAKATPERESTTQLNVRIKESVKKRADQGVFALSAREGRRVALNELVENALAFYLDANDM